MTTHSPLTNKKPALLQLSTMKVGQTEILEENCFKDFGGNLFKKNFEEICFKDFGGKSFQRFWRKIVSKI